MAALRDSGLSLNMPRPALHGWHRRARRVFTHSACPFSFKIPELELGEGPSRREPTGAVYLLT